MSVLDWFMDCGWKMEPSTTCDLQWNPTAARTSAGGGVLRRWANTLTMPINFEFNFDCASRRAKWGGFFIAKWDEQLPSMESETWVNCTNERTSLPACLSSSSSFLPSVRLLQLILQPQVHRWWAHLQDLVLWMGARWHAPVDITLPLIVH